MTQIILHVGAPKTGTTAIQGFLAQNEEELRECGVNYTQTERPHIAHNVLPRLLRRGGGADYLKALQAEIESSNAQVHVISSEMLFRPPVASQIAEDFKAHLPKEMLSGVRVVCYLRRHDQYIEAMYKQLVKNGKISADPAENLAQMMATLSFAQVLEAYGQALGAGNVIARPFDRSAFHGNDVVQDFIDVLGVPEVRNLELAPPNQTNRTLSGEISEMLGQLSLNTGLNTRQMIRDIIGQNAPGAFAKNDVYDAETRTRIVRHFEDDDARLCAWTGKADGSFFDRSDLTTGPSTQETSDEVAARWREAAGIVAKAIGNQMGRA